MVVLEYRGIEVPFFVRQRIRYCMSPDLLRTWLIRALTATSAAEVVWNKRPPPGKARTWRGDEER
jgi:hypothetical protein